MRFDLKRFKWIVDLIEAGVTGKGIANLLKSLLVA